MALTLAQAAVADDQPLRRGVTRLFVQASYVLDRLPFMPIAGNTYGYILDGTLPGVAFRGVNEAYVESTGTFNQQSEHLVILGGDADVDRFIQQTMSNLINQEAEQIRLKTTAMAYKFQDAFFNGDVSVDAKGFDGLKKRLVGTQVLDAGTNGLSINADEDSRHNFMDLLDDLVARVPGINAGNGALYMNAAVQAKFTSALRRLGQNPDFIREDLTGKRVLTWNGIPVVDPGQGLVPNGDGTFSTPDVVRQNETLGNKSDTSSIYAVKFGRSEGDGGVTGLTNGGIQVDRLGQLQDKPATRTRIEFYPGLAVFGGRAAARLRGVRTAA